MDAERAEILKLVGQLIMIQTRNLAGPAVPPAWINEIEDPLIKALKTATFLKQHLKKQRSIADNDAMTYICLLQTITFLIRVDRYLCAQIKKQALALTLTGQTGGSKD